MQLKYFSTFSGIGGFELGIQKAYDDLSKAERVQQRRTTPDSANTKQSLLSSEQPCCVGFSETDKYACQVYNKNFNHKNYGDITKINEKTLPEFHLLVGGFPCQSFSIAGKRGGFKDTRGTLFFEIARIIKQKQPRLLLLENVKGLLSHDKGNTFFTIISTLDELGYDCQWQVLNSKNHGVPQNRERVFIIGHLRGTRRPEVFPIEAGSENTNGKIKVIRNSYYDTDRLYSPAGIARTMRANAGGKGAKTGLYKINRKGKLKTYQENASCLTVAGKSGGNHSDMDLLIKDSSIRRLTPRECERLQGFPDDWTKYGVINKIDLVETIFPDKFETEDRNKTVEISDSQRYKMLGNAVTVNVIREIMKKIIVN